MPDALPNREWMIDHRGRLSPEKTVHEPPDARRSVEPLLLRGTSLPHRFELLSGRWRVQELRIGSLLRVEHHREAPIAVDRNRAFHLLRQSLKRDDNSTKRSALVLARSRAQSSHPHMSLPRREGRGQDRDRHLDAFFRVQRKSVRRVIWVSKYATAYQESLAPRKNRSRLAVPFVRRSDLDTSSRTHPTLQDAPPK